MDPLRITSCPCPDDCEPVDSYADRICAGMIVSGPKVDPNREGLTSGEPCLKNTCRLCLEGIIKDLQFNDEDAFLIIRTLQRARDVIKARGLYSPGRGKEYDFDFEKLTPKSQKE
jgi:hypothetical protein